MPMKTKIEPVRTVSRAQLILDIAFQRATKVSASGHSPMERARSLTGKKIGRASGMLLRHLAIAKAPFRKKDVMTTFTSRIIEARLGEGRLARSLSRLQVAEARLLKFRTEAMRQMRTVSDPQFMKDSMRRFYGRAASVLEEIEADLDVLEEARQIIRESPHVEDTTPTVVVVGYPNVGKSSLIGKLTSATPKVAPYPFTTVAVGLGHAQLGPTLWTQMVDTPGLMLRQSQKGAKASAPDSLQETSEVEKEAIVAVEATTGIVLLLADPTGSCGWPLPEQMRLFEMLKTNYPDRKFVVVENKADLMRVESPHLKISCLTGEGMTELVGAVETALGGSPRHRPWRAPDKS